MKKLKNSFYSGAVALAMSLPALAEGTGGSSEVYETVVSDAQSKLESILTTGGEAVAALVVAGLAIWGAIAIVGVLKRAFSAGKGR